MPVTAHQAKSLTQLISLRAAEQPDDPAIYTGIPEPGNAIKLHSISYSELVRAVDRLAWHYQSIIKPTIHLDKPQVISVLVNSSIDETLLEVALVKLGLTPFLLSVNNSVPAVAHLTKVTGATHIIYSPKFSEEAKGAQRSLEAEGYQVGVIEEMCLPLFGDSAKASLAQVQSFSAPLTPAQEASRPAVILHSSGSTGFPKPIHISHAAFVANITMNKYQSTFSTSPVFHALGHTALFVCISAGKPFVLFPPHLPLTLANICKAYEACPHPKPEQFFVVPYVIKLLAETEEGMHLLSKFNAVAFGGAPLPEDLGDRLTAANVNFVSIYGSTEAGVPMDSERDYSTDKLWNYLKPNALAKDYLKFEPQGNDMYELVILDGFPSKVKSNRSDNSYATNDLFERHPTLHDRYRYMGRLDDTLVHVLGEKTNPIPIESAIRGNSPYVAEAIVFGAAKPQTGVLIFPSKLAVKEGLDRDKKALFNKIWPVVEQANEEAPSHSRLLPEMVEFLEAKDVDRIPRATKMSILRSKFYNVFSEVIESVYARFETDSSEVTKRHITTQTEMEEYLLDIFGAVVGPSKKARLTRDLDLFGLGVDSLQATRVRNVFVKELEGVRSDIGSNVVYESGTIARLAAYLLGGQTDEVSREQKMMSLVDKYIGQFDPYEASPTSGPRVVLLTGATGSLGAHILYRLVESPPEQVKKVICISRARSHAESRERVKDSLKQRMLDLSGKDERWESYAGDVNVSMFGIEEEIVKVWKEQITDVIHNAWPVNFNISVSSFEPHVYGVVNLLNTLRPQRFYYSSSIAARMAGPNPECAEDFADDVETSAPTGYGESKWVVERILRDIAQKVKGGVQVGVFRIGQLVGDSVHGVWNETEAWPLMFKSADTIGAIPVLNENPSWLPVDRAGQAIVDIVLAPAPETPAQVYNIVNPDITAHWSNILDGLEMAGLKFRRVSPSEWLTLLAAEPDAEKNPPIKLLGFYKDILKPNQKAPVVFRTDVSGRVSQAIRDCPSLNSELVGKWVGVWRKSRFLNKC